MGHVPYTKRIKTTFIRRPNGRLAIVYVSLIESLVQAHSFVFSCVECCNALNDIHATEGHTHAFKLVRLQACLHIGKEILLNGK